MTEQVDKHHAVALIGEGGGDAAIQARIEKEPVHVHEQAFTLTVGFVVEAVTLVNEVMTRERPPAFLAAPVATSPDGFQRSAPSSLGEWRLPIRGWPRAGRLQSAG